MSDASDNRVWLDTGVRPHLAMSPRGLRWVSVALLAPAVLSGVIAIALRAWPITCFLGGEAGLACLALYWNAKRLAEQRERVLLTDNDLIVESWDRDAALGCARLEPAWARVERTVRPYAGCEAIVIRSNRQSVRVADALGPDQRAVFADALEAALIKRKQNLVRIAA